MARVRPAATLAGELGTLLPAGRAFEAGVATAELFLNRAPESSITCASPNHSSESAAGAGSLVFPQTLLRPLASPPRRHGGACARGRQAGSRLQRSDQGETRQGERGGSGHYCWAAAPPPPPPGDGGEASILLRLPPRLQTGVDLSNVKMSMNPFCEVWLCGPPSDVQCTVANSWKSSHRSAMQNALPALCCSSHTNRSGAGSHQQRDRGAGCLTALARVSSRL